MTDSSTPYADPSSAGGTDELVGQVIADRYRVLAPIGGGGMGLVYRAEQITLGKTVAIKVLKREYSDQPIYLERFLQEARAASQIGHENVVDIIDFGQIPGGSAFFAMEHLEGEDLDQVLDREGRLPWSRVRLIVRQVMRALEAAHRRGIVHRDMKPANCFMVRRSDGIDQVKVFDFGIAKVKDLNAEGTSGLTQTGAIFGTAKYMAPEQARGEKVDHRTDIYALGVMMFELLTGRVPFLGDNFMQVLTQHLTSPPPVPSTVAPEAGIAPEVDHLILRAMSKNPDDRFGSMAEFEAAMLALDGEVRPATGDFGTAEGRVAPTQYNPDVDLSQLTSLQPKRGRTLAWVAGVVVVTVAAFFGLQAATSTDKADTEVAAASAVEPAAAPSPGPGPVFAPGASAAQRSDEPGATPDFGTPHEPAAVEPTPADPAATATPPAASPAQDDDESSRPSKRRRRRPRPDKPATDDLPKPPKTKPESSSTPSGSDGGSKDLSASAIRKGLATVDSAVKACRDKHGGIAGMTVRVRFMVASGTGAVQTASALRPHANTPLGQCVADAVRRAKFPTGYQMKVTTQAFRL